MRLPKRCVNLSTEELSHSSFEIFLPTTAYKSGFIRKFAYLTIEPSFDDVRRLHTIPDRIAEFRAETYAGLRVREQDREHYPYDRRMENSIMKFIIHNS